jgi:competence protein ComEC
VQARGNAVRLVDTPRFSAVYWIGRLRAWQADLFASACPEQVRPFIFAVWLGQREHMEPQAAQAYIDTGTAHMLSVSGLHVAIIYYSIEFLLVMVIRRERPRAAVVLVAVVVYALLAGARAATLRAALVIAVYQSARLVRREPDAPTALAVAAFLLLVWNPALVFDVGALLSFASVASLLLYADPFTEWMHKQLRVPRPVAGPLAACVAVQALTLPMSAAWFHVLPLSAPLANLIAVPLLDAVLWCCVGVTLAGAILPAAAPLFGHAAWAPVAAIEGLINWLGSFDSLALLVPSPSLPAMLCFYGAMLLPVLMIRKRRATEDMPVPLLVRWRVPAACVVLLGLSVVLWKPTPPRAQMDVLDVGHGDAAVVFPPGGGAVLVDGGDRTEFRDNGRAIVLPFLLAHGVTRLDAIIATHPDRDHVGGLFALIESIPVGRVILSAQGSTRPLETGLIALCRDKGIPIERMGAGEEWTLHGARFEVLHPPESGWVAPTVNETSLVMRLTWDTESGEPFSALLTGDVESAGELLLSQSDCRASVLRVPHHGSSTSSSAALLDAVAPQVGIVSTRTTNRRNAIGPGVAERYIERGIPLWRTDSHGGIRITGDPPGLLSARKVRGWLP